MPERSLEKVLKLLESNEVVEFKDFQAVLDNASRATTCRYLKQVPYHRSYNYNGRFYTRKDPTRYDRFGLFSYKDILFSRDTTVGQTIRRLVWESVAGWTQRELQEVLRVRVQVALLDTYRRGKIDRENINGVFVYLHPDPAVRQAQLTQRREQITASELSVMKGEMEISEYAVIQVLLTLLRHPGAKAADVGRYLRGHCPAISMAQIRMVFSRYELDQIDKKGGASSC